MMLKSSLTLTIIAQEDALEICRGIIQAQYLETDKSTCQELAEPITAITSDNQFCLGYWA